MEELKILLELVKTQGLASVLAGLYIWEKIILKRIRKASGKYVSWEDMNSRLERLAQHHTNLLVKVDAIIEQRIGDNILNAKLHSDHYSLKEKVGSENYHIFDELKSINEKIDSLKNILLQKQL